MRVGADVVIDPDTIFKRPDEVDIGTRVAIDKGFYCTTALRVGDVTHVGPYVTCIGGAGARCEMHGFNNVMAGARLVCASDRFDESGLPGAMIPSELKGRVISEPVIIEKFANVGTNAIVLPGARLRRGAMLCAGSLLMGDTVEWGVYKGNPAELVRVTDGSERERLAQDRMFIQ